MRNEENRLKLTMWTIWVIIFWISTVPINAVPPVCDLLSVLKREEEKCVETLSLEAKNRTTDNDLLLSSGETSGVKDQKETSLKLVGAGLKKAGSILSYPGLNRSQQDLLCLIQLAFQSTKCAGMWDNMSCWPSSTVGQTVNAHCPEFFQMLTGKKGFVYRNCTSEGWSDPYPRPDIACGYNVNDTTNEARRSYFMTLKTMYTIGYCTSLVTLTIALVVLASFRCWDINTSANTWWIIRGPIVLSIFINFILFVNILRILMRKLSSPEGRSSDFNQYKRLAKSTLLLIPLFGIHYIIFAFFPEDASSGTMEIQLFFELALGSFQGFVVAVLYCFLNGSAGGSEKMETVAFKQTLASESQHLGE
ncbi:hypothetical protein WISP_125034 [Willisornis vidua]|uniref:Secretin receptor n=1 Tax=Willisornis vidua TaxID=1566151 RepID=A0ABQ9CWV9_9PASS|nr:hypothetical protein WISP_125034 [Willisornis vidua]